MKATVGRWTALQTNLPETDEGNALWRKIEYRTWGKGGQTKVAIALTKDESSMVEAAGWELEKEYGKYVEMPA